MMKRMVALMMAAILMCGSFDTSLTAYAAGAQDLSGTAAEEIEESSSGETDPEEAEPGTDDSQEESGSVSEESGTSEAEADSTEDFGSAEAEENPENEESGETQDELSDDTSEGEETVTAEEEAAAEVPLTAAEAETEDEVTDTVTEVLDLTPEATVNTGNQDYVSYWATPLYSYLEAVSDGFMRVEYTGSKIVVEYYDSSYTLTAKKYVSMELELFGGFYAGSDAYYLVYGQENTAESDDVEVIRIVKYSKDWERLGDAGLYGANTYIPFDAGSCRMTEYGGYLYIRTSHEMYLSSDGYHHQVNLMIEVDEGTMEITDSYYKVMNNLTGYVSHSFNQFIIVDDEKNLVAVDHGDALPRAAILFRYNKEAGSSSFGGSTYGNNSNVSLLSFQGSSGQNYTGASLGGLEYSSSSYLTAGNSVDQDDNWSSHTAYNVFVAVTSRDDLSTTVKWITDYDTDGSTTASTPQLVKLGTDSFLLLWTTTETADASTVYSDMSKLHYVYLDGEGNTESDIYTVNGQLSDCQPIVSDGSVIWYVTGDSAGVRTSSAPYFCSVSSDGSYQVQGAMDEPANVQVVSAGSGKATVSWDAVDGATGYRVYQAYLNGCTPTKVSDGSTTSTTISLSNGNESGSLYYIWVEAYSGDTRSLVQNKYRFYYLSTPTSLTLTEEDSVLALSWSAVGSAEGYYVYRAANGGAYELAATVQDTSWTDDEVTVGVTWSYQVFAYSGDDISAGSAVKSYDFHTLGSCTIKISYSTTSYTGEEKTPAVTVTDPDGNTLTAETDYVVSYSDNVEVDTAVVTVTGVGNWGGSVTKTFVIQKGTQSVTASLSSSSIEIGGTTVLTASTSGDGTLTWTSGDESIATIDGDGVVNGLQAGSVKITIEAAETDHYSSATKSLTLTVYDPGDFSRCTATLDTTSFTYDGTAQEPEVTVTDADGETLTEGTDYTVEYSDNVNVGTATVTITACKDYSGQIVKTFKITKATMKVLLSGYSNSYDGEEHSISFNIITGPENYRIYYSTAERLTASNYETIGSKESPARMFAGTTSVYYYIVDEDGNYSSYYNTTAQSLSVKPVVSVESYKGSYDGQSHAATVTAEGNATVYFSDSKALTYKNYTDGSTTSPGQTEVGTTSIYYIAIPDDGTVSSNSVVTGTTTVTITRAEQTITSDDLVTVVAGETAQIGAVTSGDSVLSYTSSKESVVTVDEDGVITGLKPGTATITISAPETDYYASATRTIYVDVTYEDGTMPTMDVTCTSYSGTYNGSRHVLTLTVSGPENYDIYYSTSQLDRMNYTKGLLAPMTYYRLASGEMAIYYYVVDNDENYADFSGVGYITIKPKVTATAYSGEYDGAAHSATVTATGSATVYYSTEVELNADNYSTEGTTTKPTLTRAGSLTVYYAAVPDDCPSESTIVTGSTTITITRTTPAINATVSDYSGIYDGAAHTISLSGDDLAGCSVYYSTDTVLDETNYQNGETTPPSRTMAGQTAVYYFIKDNADENEYITGEAYISISPAVEAEVYAGSYDGDAHSAVVKANGGAVLYYSESEPLSYSNYNSGTTTIPERTDAGTTTVYYIAVPETDASEDSVTSGSTTITVAPGNISEFTAELSETCYTYNKSAHEPAVTLKNVAGELLTEGTDYTISYNNNTELGTAMVTISGIGNYTGTITQSFSIVGDLTDTELFTVTIPEEIWYYDGTEKTPEPEVKFGNLVLTVNADYTVSYSNNIEPGTATVTIRGCGDYEGIRECEFNISPAHAPTLATRTACGNSAEAKTGQTIDFSDLEDLYGTITSIEVVSVTEDPTVEGSVLESTPTVDGLKVVFNTCTGTYGDYADIEVKITFAKYEATTCTIHVTMEDYEVEPITDLTYTGSALKPLPEVYDGTTLLTRNTHYTLSYKNNTKAGTATVTVKGKGNYTSSKTVEFTILQKDLGAEDITATVSDKATTATVTGKDGKLLSKYYSYPTLKYGKLTLKKGTDYDLSFELLDGGDAENGYEVRVTITGKGNYTGTRVLSYRIATKNISGVVVSSVSSQTWTGGEIRPEIKVYASSSAKKAKTELDSSQYSISYANNTAVGTAKIILTGQGAYSGTKTVTFKITKKSLSATATAAGEIEVLLSATGEDDSWVTPEKYSVTYDAGAQKPCVQVSYTPADGSKIVLTEGTDYKLSYKNNTNAVTTGTAKSKYPTVTVTAKGSCFSGSRSVTFDIGQFKLTEDNTKITVTDAQYSSSVAKNGAKPSATVQVQLEEGADYITLKKGTAYSIAYEDNKEIGDSAVALISGSGNYYTDEALTANFRIYRSAASSLYVTVTAPEENPDMIFTGSAIEPTVTVYASSADRKNQVDPLTELDANDESFDGTEDGYTISYSNNTNAGSKAQIKITGWGQYGGTKTVTFTIARKALNKTDFVIDTAANEEIPSYTGKAIKLTEDQLTVTDADRDDGYSLVPGTDYSVSYSNNTNAVTDSTKASKYPTVKITGKGNYKGSVSETFTITPFAMDEKNTQITVSDVKYSTSVAKSGAKPTVTVKVTLDGTKWTTLKKGTGYVLSGGTGYTNNYEKGEKTDANPPTVTIAGKGNYSTEAQTGGVMTQTFRIYDTSVSGLYVTVESPVTYTGSRLTPEVKVYTANPNKGGTELLEGTAYELSYGENVNKGKGYIYVNGIGKYGGTKTVSFTIQARKLR